MQIAIELPDEIVVQLGGAENMSQRVKEEIVVDAYRQGKLSRHQVGQALQRDYWQTEELLLHYQAKRPYALSDLEIDRDALAALEQR